MAQYPSRFPAQLDTFVNHGSKDGIGLDIDWQKSDELSSNELDLITDAILELERDVTGFPDELKNLLTAEIQQLENIGASTISVAQWGYLGVLDQTVQQAAVPTFVAVSLTSGQIAFPAAQVPSGNANTLDDYEEGTWTMGISFGGAAVGVTYSSQTGFYTKIGDIVHLTGYMVLTNKGVSVGAAAITGLPFASNAAVGNHAVASLLLDVISYANQSTNFLTSGASAIDLYELTEAGTATTLTDANFANTSNIRISLTYIT